jgi:hypothetical protein
MIKIKATVIEDLSIGMIATVIISTETGSAAVRVYTPEEDDE